MDPEERIIYESALAEYRQALADVQWALAQANGRNKVLTALLEAASEPEPEPAGD